MVRSNGASTCLVTGGAGFIGSAASSALADTFDHVVAVDNMHPQVHPDRSRPEALDPRVDLVVGDVTEKSTWDEVLGVAQPDVLIHLAAETGTGQSLEESSRHAVANVVGTTRMLDALTQHGHLPSRIVLCSSRAVYGEGVWEASDGTRFHPPQRTALSLAAGDWDYAGALPTPMDARTTEPWPVSVYGVTKLTQEHLLRVWSNAKGVETAVLRLQNVYGPGQSFSNPYTGIMTLFCRIARAGRSIPLYEDGLVRRDFVLIDDVARAVHDAATAPQTSSTPIDIGSGEHQTIADAAALIARWFGAPDPHVTGQFREGDVRHAWADVSAAREVLGWEPAFDLRSGVDLLARWIDKQTLPPLG